MKNNLKTQDVTVTSAKSEFSGMPRLILNDIDKVYLATAVKSVDKLTFIYTLVCRGEKRQYDIVPCIEVAAFDNRRDANIFYRTVNQIMELQSKLNGLSIIREASQKYIDDFHRRTR